MHRVMTFGKRTRRKLPVILTVGHSTRTGKEFIDLLRAHGVRQLVDVRTIPRSSHNPQFDRTRLSRALRQAGIAYCHMAALGGLRHSAADSINTGWRNKSFRGYADYMQTRDFQMAIHELIALATRKRVAVMCAEAVPWRCHRSLIADALLIRGFPVEEIQSRRRTRPHLLTPWARVEGVHITYPEVAAPTNQQELPAGLGRRNRIIILKRVYEESSSQDGKRFLVERLWPCGIRKTAIHMDAWLKELGPSVALRKWFGHDPEKWNEFRQRYFRELETKPELWREIQKVAQSGNVTLLYSSHDTAHNNAVALKEFIETKKRNATGGTLHPRAA